MTALLALGLLGLAGGFFSGLLGLGGSIIMVPLLLFVPPLLGMPVLDMKQVAAMSMVQVFFASLAGMITHWRNRYVSRQLVVDMGGTSALASLAGGLVSIRVESQLLLTVFAVIATLGSLLMFLPRGETNPDTTAEELRYNRPLAFVAAGAVGLVGGLIGAPGAFIYVPILLYVLRIPLRIALGSTLAIVLATAAFGVIGKVVTGQVEWLPALALVAGAVPGARWGGRLSRNVPAPVLRTLLALVVSLSTIQVWSKVL